MKPLTYKDSGVDLDAGDAFVKRIRSNAILTMRPEVIGNLGGFAGLFALPTGYEKPVLVSCTDGVGSKLLLALENNEYLQNVGHDLVAMVVNDIICCGAEPLYFLDYYASGKLDGDSAYWFLEGVTNALLKCNMSLLGGETAELPGMYKKGHFDAAGFGVGIIEQGQILNGDGVDEGDVVIGLTSSGPHANGFSLIRRILKEVKPRGGKREMVHRLLMEPTHLYHETITDLLNTVAEVKAIANITGGGLFENVPRVVDERMKVVIDPNAWEVPHIFNWIQKHGNVDWNEMYRVFNMGIGMVVVVSPDSVDIVKSVVEDSGIEAHRIGDIIPSTGGARVIIA